MSSTLDLKDWFNQEDSYINLFLNDEILLQDSKDPIIKLKQDFLDKYWLFMVKNKVFQFPSDSKISYGDKLLDLGEIHNLFLETKKKWSLKHNNSKNFPDIIFSKINLGSSIFIDKELDKNHIIMFEPSVLENFDDLKFTLGHELGHIDYLDNHQHKPFFNLDKTQVRSLILTAISLIGLSINSIGNWRFFLAFSLFISYLSIFYIILSSLTYKVRIKNYRREFYCDSYSAYLVGKVPVDKLSLGNDPNGFTHPSSELRKLFYSNFKEIDFYNWTSPTESHLNHFKYLSVRSFLSELNSIILKFS